MNSLQNDNISRWRLRFPYKGWCNMEDLWDLSPTQLDTVYKTLSRQVKDIGDESLLNSRTNADHVLELQIEVVTYVFDVIVAEQEAYEQRANKRLRKQKLLTILETKQESKLHEMSE